MSIAVTHLLMYRSIKRSCFLFFFFFNVNPRYWDLSGISQPFLAEAGDNSLASQ